MQIINAYLFAMIYFQLIQLFQYIKNAHLNQVVSGMNQQPCRNQLTPSTNVSPSTTNSIWNWEGHHGVNPCFLKLHLISHLCYRSHNNV